MESSLFLVIIGSIVTFIIYYIYAYNTYVTRLTKTEQSLSGIDVALSKRFNLITNLVETVKGFAAHEKAVFEKITEIRNNTHDDLHSYNESMTQVKAQLFALVENYPVIKSDTNFLHLQKALVDCEEHLQAARRLHNQNVNMYNTFIQTTPNNLLNPMKSAKIKPYFEATSKEQALVNIKL